MREPWDLLGRQHRLYLGEKRAGWDPDDANTFAEEIAHLHEEVSEAFRAFRQNKHVALTTDDAGKPQGVPAEFADVVIGMYYIAERFGFDLDAAVETSLQPHPVLRRRGAPPARAPRTRGRGCCGGRGGVEVKLERRYGLSIQDRIRRTTEGAERQHSEHVALATLEALA